MRQGYPTIRMHSLSNRVPINYIVGWNSCTVKVHRLGRSDGASEVSVLGPYSDPAVFQRSQRKVITDFEAKLIR